MKHPLILIVAMALTGCEFARVVAPQTTSGFEANGIIGALDGASGAIIAKCERIDGIQIRMAIDETSELAQEVTGLNVTDAKDKIRARREALCQSAGKVAAVFVEDE